VAILDNVTNDLCHRLDAESEERLKLTLMLMDGRQKKGFFQRLLPKLAGAVA
jgi:hypothetical protein